nr:helix-turn-helix domain-containing protein [uncultured Draconibacterium sp.]
MLKTKALSILLSFLVLFVIHKIGYSETRVFYLQSVPSTTDELNQLLDSLSYRLLNNNKTGQNDMDLLIANKASYFDTGNTISEAAYYCKLAVIHQMADKHETAYIYLDSALHTMPASRSRHSHLKILEFGVRLADKNRDYNSQIKLLKQMHSSGVLSENPIKLADVFLDIADYSWNMHAYDQSMEYCNKALPLVQDEEYWEGKIRALLLMYHNAHFSTNDTTWSLYLDEALKLAEQLNDSTQLSSVYYTIGYSHYRENDQERAIEYYKKARSFEKEKGGPSDLAIAIMQELSYSLADSVEGVNKTSSYIIRNGLQNNLYNVLGNAYRGRAWYFAKTGKKDSATHYLNKAFEHRQSLEEKKNASPGFYYALYEVAMLIPDYKLALKFLNLSEAQIRQISMENNARELGAARADLDYQLQLERIERLSVENTLEHEKTKKQQIAMFSILAVSMLAFAFLLFIRQNHKKLNSSYRELVKKNQQLDKMYNQLQQAESASKTNGNNHSNGKSIKDEDSLYKNLKILFEEEKIYRDPNLSIRLLADKLETNTTYLSLVINQRFEESFKSILNKYRVNEARLILETKQYANLTIEGIAEKVGYHSRSTFYSAFKEITGLTPTQYLNNLEN